MCAATRSNIGALVDKSLTLGNTLIRLVVGAI
jgi:hypothetical protein